MANAATEAWIWPFLAVFTLSCLVWLFALVPFSLAIVLPPHRPRLDAASTFDIREALLAMNGEEHPFRLVRRSETELRIEWDAVNATWFELFAQVKLSVTYTARLFLDEARREVRIHESLHHSNWFIGFHGWKPRFNFEHRQVHGMVNVIWSGTAFGIKPGWPPQIGRVYEFQIDTMRAVREIERIAKEQGWSVRPVIWWFEATQATADWSVRITPPFMRGWSRRLFWSVLYAASWAGLIGSIAAFVPLKPQDVMILGLVFGVIIGVHALILCIWVLLRKLSERSNDASTDQEATPAETA